MEFDKKSYTYSVFERFYQRSKIRYYDLYDGKEDPTGEFRLTIASIYAFEYSVRTLPGEMVEKYDPTIPMFMTWFEARLKKDYGDSNPYVDPVIAYMKLFCDDIYSNCEELLHDYNEYATQVEFQRLLGVLLVKCIKPNEMSEAMREQGYTSLVEYSLSLEGKTFYFDNEYEKLLYAFGSEMINVGMATEKEFDVYFD